MDLVNPEKLFFIGNRNFEFVDLVNSDLVDSESRKHRENRAFMGMIRIVSLM